MSDEFDAALVVTERDALVVELAGLRVQHRNAIKSLLNQTDVAVTAMAERDAALATIAQVLATVETWEEELTHGHAQVDEYARGYCRTMREALAKR